MDLSNDDWEQSLREYDESSRSERVRRARYFTDTMPEHDRLSSADAAAMWYDYQMSYSLGLFAATVVIGLTIIEGMISEYARTQGIGEMGLSRTLRALQGKQHPFREQVPKIKELADIRNGFIHGRELLDDRGVGGKRFLKHKGNMDAVMEGLGTEMVDLVATMISKALASKK